MGIDSIALENTNFGILNQTRDNFIALIIYLTHSFYFLSEYYESFGLKAIAYGGYTFNLIFRILNTLFNTNLSPIQDFYGIDFTIGRYATFAKHLIADFGFLGMIIFYSVCSYIFGVSSNYKNLYTSFKVIYYWLVIYFLLAPLTNIMASGYLQIMTFYLIFYSFVEIRLKKNIKNFDE